MSQYEKIKKIETYVGGYFGGYHQVEVDLENNSVTWNSWRRRKTRRISL